MAVLAGCTGSIAGPDPGAGAPDPTAGESGAAGRAGSSSGSAATGSTSGGAPASAGTSSGSGAPAMAGSGSAGGTVGSGGAGQTVSACASRPRDPGPAPLRLLTREQYLNTLSDLFGTLPDLTSALTASATASALGVAQGDISQIEIEDFQRVAELVATSAVSGSAFEKLAPCAAGADARGCAGAFVKAFGARAYRAPLTDPSDIERHLVLYDVGAATDYRHGIELLLRGMLQSSRFLYRVELGTGESAGDSGVSLSGYEVATRLAYGFWNTTPDATLAASAASGALSTESGVGAELSRVLADPRGKSSVRRFLERLIHLDSLGSAVKSAELYPEWQAASFRASLETQARSFFEHVLANQGGKLGAVLTSTTVFVNRDLAPYYGVSGGAEFSPLELGPGRAAGLLTLPAFLTLMAKPDESAPIYRGKFVREVLLCQRLPSPPPNVPKAPTVQPGVSTRERLRQHEVDPNCSGCHRLLDPIGLGFEHYDALGHYRELDGGVPVDARGEIFAAPGLDGPFDGVPELGARLAGSADVESCVARQWFRYVLNRFDESGDACSVERLVTAFHAAGGDLNTLPGAIVATDAFRFRRAIVPASP
jgi:hypothetical protein